MAISSAELNSFLRSYPGMNIIPSRNTGTVLTGKFDFIAEKLGFQELRGTFTLEIQIPNNFPEELPIVKELNGEIPNDGSYHINGDDTLCLGSPISLFLQIRGSKPFMQFIARCLVPYLYAVLFKLKNGGPFIFGELEHGPIGLLRDYQNLLKIRNETSTFYALSLVSLPRTFADKKVCPCGSVPKHRLKRCRYNRVIKKLRKIIPCNCIAEHIRELQFYFSAKPRMSFLKKMMNSFETEQISRWRPGTNRLSSSWLNRNG